MSVQRFREEKQRMFLLNTLRIFPTAFRSLDLKIAVFYIALLASLNIAGQISPGLYDTVLIKGVIISGRTKDAPLAGFKKIRLDSLQLKENFNESVASILSANTTIFIKSYGPGTSSSSSSRGTGASHTCIAWNGIKINNPMLGQSDLTLMPSGLTDEMHIYQGGGSMEILSGGLGSAVNLLSVPEWNKKTALMISTSAGTYGRLNVLAKLSTGKNNFHSVTRLFKAYSENNFLYTDPYSVSEKKQLRRENSSMKQNGFMQELYFRKPHHHLSARLWYQYADRNIPVPIIVSQLYPGEEQIDESIRALLNYDYYSGVENLNVSFAILSERLDYINPPASVDSRNKMITGVFKTSFTAPLTSGTRAKILLENNLNSVSSNNYEKGKTSNTLEIAIIAETVFSGRFTTSLLLREILLNKKLLLPDISAGVQYGTDNKNSSFLKANISRNSKIPSLNDMFWIPGGNPDLKNEYATTIEIGWETSRTFPYLNYKYDVTLFRSFIRDMIKWTPGNNTIWYATNLRKVNTAGIESSIGIHFSKGKISTDLKAAYAFTRASDVSDGSESKSGQLIYVPLHQFNNFFRLGYRNFSASLISRFTGRRYTDTGNRNFLPRFLVNDLSLGTKCQSKILIVHASFVIENIFNVEYQNTAWYPMPPRSYMLKLTFQTNRQ